MSTIDFSVLSEITSSNSLIDSDSGNEINNSLLNVAALSEQGKEMCLNLYLTMKISDQATTIPLHIQTYRNGVVSDKKGC